MEEKKKVNGIPLTVILIVVIIVLLILCTVLFYNANTSTIKYNYNVSDRTVPQVVDAGFISALVDTKGDVYIYSNHYLPYHDNVVDVMEEFESKYKIYYPQGYVDGDGNHSLNALKLDISNVLSVYYVLNNGTSGYFIFVKDGGNVSYVNASKFLYNSMNDIKDIPELTNVVSVINNTYDKIPYVITVDGHEILLSDYLK